MTFQLYILLQPTLVTYLAYFVQCVIRANLRYLEVVIVVVGQPLGAATVDKIAQSVSEVTFEGNEP